MTLGVGWLIPREDPSLLTTDRWDEGNSVAPRSLLAELSATKRKTTLDGPGIDLTVTYRKVSGAPSTPNVSAPRDASRAQLS